MMRHEHRAASGRRVYRKAAAANVTQRTWNPRITKNNEPMKLIKAGLGRMKSAQLVAKSDFVEGKMKGNTNFPTPSPSLTDLTAARTALVAAVAEAESGAHAAIASKNAAVAHLRDLLTKMARYVNSVAGGDVDMAVSSGFELAKRPDPIDKLSAPLDLRARMSDHTGRIDLRWTGVRGGRLFRVYICDGDPAKGEWKPLDYVTKGKYTVTGLESHKLYAFRVTALGRVGEGPASEIVSAKAA